MTEESIVKTDPKTLAEWREHWQDEFDAAYLYRLLSSLETDPKRKGFFDRFVQVEERHCALWSDILATHGSPPPASPKPTVRARGQAWLARRFGPKVLVGHLLREEGLEVKSYLRLHDESDPGITKDTALTLAHESAEHAEDLRRMTGGQGESWHHTSSGGFLLNIVYGFNDGLTANFGLVAGVIGGSAAAIDERTVIVAGVAGMVANALSMASSGYLAAKSEREVYAHEIEMERREIEMMPEVEQEELALIYETRGMEREQAVLAAASVMRSPTGGLEEKVRAELGIGDSHTTPMKEGVLTGIATAIGSLLTVVAFFVLDDAAAIWTSFAIAMSSHFGIGAARSFFTGRSLLRSGFDMFAVGLGVAVIGFYVGEGIQRLL